jgi:hypothetical protein
VNPLQIRKKYYSQLNSCLNKMRCTGLKEAELISYGMDIAMQVSFIILLVLGKIEYSQVLN